MSSSSSQEITTTSADDQEPESTKDVSSSMENVKRKKKEHRTRLDPHPSGDRIVQDGRCSAAKLGKKPVMATEDLPVSWKIGCKIRLLPKSSAGVNLCVISSLKKNDGDVKRFACSTDVASSTSGWRFHQGQEDCKSHHPTTFVVDCRAMIQRLDGRKLAQTTAKRKKKLDSTTVRTWMSFSTRNSDERLPKSENNFDNENDKRSTPVIMPAIIIGCDWRLGLRVPRLTDKSTPTDSVKLGEAGCNCSQPTSGWLPQIRPIR